MVNNLFLRCACPILLCYDPCLFPQDAGERQSASAERSRRGRTAGRYENERFGQQRPSQYYEESKAYKIKYEVLVLVAVLVSVVL